MESTSLSERAEGVLYRCRRAVSTVDRGWKATGLGVGIVLLLLFLP